MSAITRLPVISTERLRAVITVALCAVCVALMGVPAFAADDDQVRWSMKPADENGMDGRTSISLEVDPGDTVTEHVAIENLADKDVTFQMDAADGYFTRTGRFDMLTAGKESVDAGTWIAVDETVEVPAGQTRVVPLTIAVPENAEPGDHAAGVASSIIQEQQGADGSGVSVKSRVGVRVTLRVSGEIRAEVQPTVVATDYTVSWNPIRPGLASVNMDLTNTGNVRIFATGTVRVGSSSVAFPAQGENAREILPGDTQTVTVEATGVWPTFRVPVTVDVDPTMQTMDGKMQDLDPVSAGASMWAIPWPQLIVLVGVALIVWALAWNRIRSKRQLTKLLEQAREEGRKDAAAPGGTSDDDKEPTE